MEDRFFLPNTKYADIGFSNETFRYIPERDAIAGRVKDGDALTQSLFFILMTDKYSYPIFNRDYGIDISDIIGEDFNTVYNKLPYRIVEAFEVDDRVLSVLDVDINQIDETTAAVDILIEDVFEQQRMLQFGFDFS